MTRNQTVKEFMKGTKNHYKVEISSGNNVLFCGTYAELKKNGGELLDLYVISYDVDGYEDENGKDVLIIGIAI